MSFGVPPSSEALFKAFLNDLLNSLHRQRADHRALDTLHAYRLPSEVIHKRKGVNRSRGDKRPSCRHIKAAVIQKQQLGDTKAALRRIWSSALCS